MAIDFSKLTKILIIRLSSIGDILLTTPLIRSIKKKNPEVQIDFVLKEELFELMQDNPYLTNIYKYKKIKSEKQELINSLIINDYELVIDLQNNLRSREIISQLHCKILRFKKNNFKKFLLVHFKINKLKDAPQIPVRYAEAAGVQLDSEGLDFFTTNEPGPKLKAGEKYIGLCPGSKHFTKRWPKEYFIELGKRLESTGYKIVLFGGLEEVDLCFEMEKQIKNSINLCNTRISQVASDMKMCRAIYSNDSGLMHLASAVKVPVIAFFGSTVKEFGFYPYNAKSIQLEIENLSCRPCTHIGRKSCPKIHFKCMKELKPELAFNSLQNIMAS
ncbi:MAG TPA: glycosyltransferase family 9 protein [Ignavibacteriaceae bacterium]|nr:glycosyltransferase family 9 protein [Ignavibacteriaceae bacterium]